MNQKLDLPDLNALFTKSPPLDWAELRAPKIGQLSSTISNTLRNRRVEDRCANTNVALVPQLREANQNLILATFDAQDAQAAAELANQRQTEFLSMLAHELRNPLHAIIMANNLIDKITNAHPDLPKLQKTIQRQVAHLARLVDDLLDASRVNAGKISIQTSCISLQKVIESAVEIGQPIIKTRRQHLELDVPAQAILIDGDLVRLTQVFSNLLLNASKYTPEYGHLIFRVTPGQYEVEVAMIDDGAGVPLDIQPYIFDLFVQGPRPPIPAQSGLGVGLSLVRTIVQQHGGTVRMSSAGSGTGSQFVVVLPRTAPVHLPS